MYRLNIKEPLVLFGLIGFCLLVGMIGGISTSQQIETWYQILNKPSWTPPNCIFAPIWTILYIIMGISVWLIFRKRDVYSTKSAFLFFVFQLLLNAAWSHLFFGMQNPFAGFIDILVLWVAILATIKSFLKVSKLAAVLMIPYFVWVSYATCLNYSIWRMN